MPIQLDKGQLEEIDPSLVNENYFTRGWNVVLEDGTHIGAVLELGGKYSATGDKYEVIGHHADGRISKTMYNYRTDQPPEESGQKVINRRIQELESVERLKTQKNDKPATGEETMGDKTKEAVKAMQKGAARKVKARLTRKAQNTMKQFCKQAQNMIDDIEPGKKSFPDGELRKAVRSLMGSLEDNLEAVKKIAEAAGEDELVEIIQDAADALAPADPNEGMEAQPEEHGEGVDVMGLEEEAPVDIGMIDETPIA